MGSQPISIVPWTIDRGDCPPRLNIKKLELQDVTTTESIYTRMFMKFTNASLPASIRYSAEPQPIGQSTNVSLASTVAGMVGGVSPAQVASETLRTALLAAGVVAPQGIVIGPPSGTRQAAPAGAPGLASGSTPVPTVFSWDLFLQLRYRQDIDLDKYGLGDLLFSISLLPNEELTLEMKTWETSRVQQDQEDSTEQRNTSDIKSTNSTATEVAHKTETKEHTGVDAKASYSGFGFGAEVHTDWSKDTDEMNSNIAKQAQDHSEQESHDYRSTHKVRLTVSREQGSESKSVRRIRNINQAHTLNANYYEIVQQSKHTLNLYDATLVLLGLEPDLNKVLNYQNVGEDTPPQLTLGLLLRNIRSDQWIDQFIDKNGVSPIKVLYQLWAAPLYEGALVNDDYVSADTQIDSQRREDFRATMLRYVHPSQGWVEPDETGALRWGYEIYPDREQECLTFLYGFLPNSVQQHAALVQAKGADLSSAYHAVTTRYAQAVQPSYVRVAPIDLRTVSLLTGITAAPAAAENAKIQIPGLFNGAIISGQAANLERAIANVTQNIQTRLAEVRKTFGIKGSWTTTIPTHGVYCDLTLGLCSGAEDYIEIQRQFDLERRRLENDRLQFENDRLKAGQPIPTIPTVTVENKSDQTQLSLELAMPPGAIPTRA